jgi:hypothetical protein
MKIGSIKPHIVSLSQFWREDAQSLQIPTIQRQFVWDVEDVRDLLDSILNGYPIGAIIIWEPTSSFPSAPLLGKESNNSRRYVLDGQQRLTALSLVLNNWCIARGDKTIRTTAISYVPETNRLYMSEKKGIDISLIVKATMGDVDSLLKLQKDYAAAFRRAMETVGQKIVNYQLPMYILKTDSGDDESAYEKIAEIFTRVNSAGVKIGNLEMFLSFFAAAFPKKEKDRIIAIHELFSAGFELDLEPLVRFLFSRMGMTQNSITKVQAFKRSIQTLRERYAGDSKAIGIVLDRAEAAVKSIIGLLDAEFGIASTQFVPSQNTLLPLFDYAYERQFASEKDIKKKDRKALLYWFVVASYNGAYSSSPNHKIDEDLELIRGAGASFPLKELLKAMKGRPPRANDIDRASVVDVRYNVLRGRTGKEYLMLLDILLHRNQATDWAGRNVKSEEAAVHHIFPREFLKSTGETRDDLINCLGNLTFIDPSINSEIGDTPPDTYLKDYVMKDHDIFQRHMIPSDTELWKVENFEAFLDARLKLIWRKTSELLKEMEE